MKHDIINLSDAETNKSYIITNIDREIGEKTFKHLMDLGFSKYVPVHVINQDKYNKTIEIRGSKLAMNKETLAYIQVREVTQILDGGKE